MPFPHASRLHTSLKQSGELLSDAIVNQRQFAANNAQNNNLFSSISNNISNNKSVIDGISASVSNMQNTINTNQTNINQSLDNLKYDIEHLTTNPPPSNLSETTRDILFKKTNVLFEEAFNSVDINIKDTTAAVLFAKNLISIPNNFSITDIDYKYIDYSPIREQLDAKYATVTELSPVNVNIWSTDFENNDTTDPNYEFVFNNIMYSKFEEPEYNNQDNTIISLWSGTNDIYNRIRKISSDLSNILNVYLGFNSSSTHFFHLLTYNTISQSSYPVVIYAYFFKYNDSTYSQSQWSVIFSSSSLVYDSIAMDKTLYNTFTESIASALNTWVDDTSNDTDKPVSRDISTVIEYGSPLNFNSLRCLSSPILGWSGQLVSELIMNGSDFDIAAEYKDTITKLWNYFPGLLENDIVIITGTLYNHFYCNIIKIVSNSGKLYFIQKQLNINSYFPAIEFKNDLVINGSLEIKNILGENVLKTDNVSNIMTIGQKVGINQDVYQVKGLLDIDNLANKTVDIILNNFTKPLLDSYELTEKLKTYLIFASETDTNKYILDSSTYVQKLKAEYKFASFSCPILQSISEDNIYFDHTETDIKNPNIMFSTRRLIPKSFGRIKTIVSNVYTMLNLDGLLPDTTNILSFCELLGDGYNTSLCSLRAVIKQNTDTKKYFLHFFVTYSIINNYYNDNSYKQNIDSLCDSLSRINQFLNYSNFLVEDQDIQKNMLQGKTNDTEGETFSGHINNSPFFRNRFGDSKLYIGIFNYPGEQSLFKLHELYRWWENKPGISNFIPNTDVQIDTVLNIIHESHKSRFGDYKPNYTFPVQYDFNTGPKLSFVKIIEIQGTKYVMFCGMNINDYVDLSIISKGDNKFTGNLSVVDETTNNNVFNVDTLNKNCSSMYNTGIGTNNPKTKLDINDCGVMDVINIENSMSERLSEMNKLLADLKTYMASNGDQNITAFFNTQSQLVQNPNHYYTLHQHIYDGFNITILLDRIIHYNPLYPTWTNRTVKDILATEVQNKSSINLLYSQLQDAFDKNMYYDGSFRIKLYPWINGIKLSLSITFKVNDKFYVLRTGIDLQNFVTINTNANIRSLTDILSACGNIFQDMVTKTGFNNIPDNQILNKNVSQTNRAKIINNSIDKIRMFKYDIDTQDNENTIITKIDPLSYTSISEAQQLKNINDFQFKNKITLLVVFLKQYYGTSLVSGQYGTIHCEDDYFDYIVLFWVKSNTQGILTIYSLEITINDIIVPSIQLRGDAIIKGDLYMYDNSKKENFLVIDSDNRFMGINTSQIYGNYSNGYSTTSNDDLAKHHVYIRTDSYPNTVIERQAERSEAVDSPDGRNPYYYFKSFTTLSSRRQSDYYTFEEMATNKDLYWAENQSGHPNAYGDDSINQFAYGSIVSFEIKDKTGVIKELGGMGVLMESMETVRDPILDKDFNDVRCGFEVNVVDRLTGSTQTNERVIMYCSNDSNLYVNNLTTNKINFNNNEKLVTGQVLGQPYNKPASENKTGQLWVDPDTGDLMFTNSNGVNKKVKLEEP